MKQAYTHESHFMVNNIRHLIEAAGINSFIKNEFSQGAVGEVSAFDAWPEIWVFNDADLARAEAIVESALHPPAGGDWICAHCKEQNAASFEICWHCQHLKPS